jgi:hypothetical protein
MSNENNALPFVDEQWNDPSTWVCTHGDEVDQPCLKPATHKVQPNPDQPVFFRTSCAEHLSELLEMSGETAVAVSLLG